MLYVSSMFSTATASLEFVTDGVAERRLLVTSLPYDEALMFICGRLTLLYMLL